MTYREASRLLNREKVRDLKTGHILCVEGVRIDISVRTVTISCVDTLTFERADWDYREVGFASH